MAQRNPIDTIHDPSSSVMGLPIGDSVSSLNLTSIGDGQDKLMPVVNTDRLTEKNRLLYHQNQNKMKN